MLFFIRSFSTRSIGAAFAATRRASTTKRWTTARKYGRQDDLLLLQTRPDHAEDNWVPSARFNLLSNLTIPWSTYATVIVDTAAALASGAEDKGFFRPRLTLTSVEAFNSSGS